ncbi:MAG: MlaD family protein [Chitinophagaceae bacterium]
MKINNETKVGALTVIAITLLVLGFNFLKGRNLFKKGTFIYAKYNDTKGLVPSNPVFANGLQIGQVYEIEADEQYLNYIIVTIKLLDAYKIPNNSVAVINTNPLATSSIDIKLGDNTNWIKNGDTLRSANINGLLGDLTQKLEPVTAKITSSLTSLDTLLKNANTVLDPNTKGNLQQVIANLVTTTAHLAKTSAELEIMLNNQTGTVGKTMKNVEAFTKNLASNNDKISQTLANVEATTNKLSKTDIDGVVNKLNVSIDRLNTALTKVNSKEGTVGKLLNDETLYQNLANTLLSLNILLDDLRAHPKRYVNVSVFGKKDKGNYLTQPLPVDSLKKPVSKP